MHFLRARRGESTQAFWVGLDEESLQKAPAAMQELARGDVSVVCDQPEAEASLEWATAQDGWSEDPAPVYVHET